ncbi:MAG: nuclear transport factor 2 family protein [Burkholderiaceae bacterium]|nr:nuclear transport factor 2 family protein [Burkholderiaceae bacterium]
MKARDPRVQRIVEVFERLQPADVERLGEIYSADARFKDPFNEVQGVAPIQQVFRHMFKALREPRFVIRDAVCDGDQCFLGWDFLFRMRRFRSDEQCIRGATHLRLSADGRIVEHRDYWDAAEELYEKLPAVGALMRWLKQRANR